MFYLFNLFLGFIFVYLDFNNIDSCLIKYLTIFNNFLYLLVKSVNKTALLASLFTCIADYFLLFTNNQLAGVLCFIIVQSNYMKLLDQYTFFPFVAILLWPVNPLIAWASNYALLSLHNLYYSFKSRYQSKHQYYLFIAIFLLLCCDFFVALTNINLPVPAVFRILIWILYLPSQLFFSASQIISEK